MELKPVIIFGAKGIGRVALDIFKSNGVVVYGFLDDDAALVGTTVDEVPVLGATDDQAFLKLIGKKCDAFVALDDVKLRENMVDILLEDRKMMPVNAIHTSATIAPSATLKYGSLIGPGVIVNSGAAIGHHCIIQAGAVIDHHSKLDDFAHIGAGALVGADATIKEAAFVGMGAVIVSGITVGKKAQVGAGSVVIETVSDKSKVFGNPAKKM